MRERGTSRDRRERKEGRVTQVSAEINMHIDVLNLKTQLTFLLLSIPFTFFA